MTVPIFTRYNAAYGLKLSLNTYIIAPLAATILQYVTG